MGDDMNPIPASPMPEAASNLTAQPLSSKNDPNQFLTQGMGTYPQLPECQLRMPDDTLPAKKMRLGTAGKTQEGSKRSATNQLQPQKSLQTQEATRIQSRTLEALRPVGNLKAAEK